MKEKRDIVVIDDKGDLLQSLENTFEGDYQVRLVHSTSSINDLTNKLDIEDYLIIINEGDLNTDIRALVGFLYQRLEHVIAPIIVATSKEFNLSDEEQKFAPVISVIRKNFNPIALRHHINNILDSIESNRNLNPLSGVPGNIVINQKLVNLIDGNQDFAFMYIDLDNFKEYNEYYGFHKGDQVLLFFTKVLYDAMSSCGSETDFIGHIGGDDFVIILQNVDIVKEMGKRIITTFDASISNYYDDADLKNGYIDARNRAGEIERINIMSVSIIVMYAEEFRTSTIDNLYKNMMIYKKQAKLKKGSVMLDNFGR